MGFNSAFKGLRILWQRSLNLNPNTAISNDNQNDFYHSV